MQQPVTMKTERESFLSLAPIERFAEHYSADIVDSFFGFPFGPILESEKDLLSQKVRSIAYFSMEYGLSTNTYNALESKKPVPDSNQALEHRVFSNLRAMDYYIFVEAGHRLDLPIYSGGLGVLAGDTLKSAADRGVSLAAVGILWNKGYFKQNFWFKNGQIPEENNWDPWRYPGLVPLKTRVSVPMKSETIHLRLWKYFVYSFDRSRVVPLILLDSNVEGNSDFAKALTGQLYKSDNVEWRILQRLILGMGGMKALDALGYSLDLYHLNEGHAAFAFIEKAKNLPEAEIAALKEKFSYTCHTPVIAGHDRFQKKTLQDLVDEKEFSLMKKFGQDPAQPDVINLTELAMNTSRHINGVAQKHGEVMRMQFPSKASRIDAITNGVHAPTWTSEPIAALFDHTLELSQWRNAPETLCQVFSLKNNAVFRKALWEAHQANKKKVCSLLKNWRMTTDTFTICWARRIAAYKRPSLILQDAKRLLDIAQRVGPIQIIFAGKAHPKDDLGFTYVNEMLGAIDSLEKKIGLVRVLMLENYDTYFGKLLTSGVDVWLNNPLPPFEASGTSGMKAILNGVLQMSTLDGWMVEAADKDIGWIFGWRHESGRDIGDERLLRLGEDSAALYETLENAMKLYYATNLKNGVDPTSEWITKMINAIGQASFFNTDRMVGEYEKKIWETEKPGLRQGGLPHQNT